MNPLQKDEPKQQQSILGFPVSVTVLVMPLARVGQLGFKTIVKSY